MVRTYFNQAFHLIRQNPLFSGFYILGTGLAISMVMLLVVIYYIKVAGIYPETNRARMMVISDVHMQSVDNSNSNSTGLIAYNIVKDLFLQSERYRSGFCYRNLCGRRWLCSVAFFKTSHTGSSKSSGCCLLESFRF